MKKLETRDLTCAYNGHPVLEDLCVQAHPGEVLALIGPNGVGKSTLLRAMARLMEPKRGTVLLAGQDVWHAGPREVARQLALAPQASGMAWAITVEQAVSLGRAPHRGWLLPYTAQDRMATEQALEQAGLSQLRHRLLTELSGGEQQRVVLARVLAQEPQVLLLDEPTSHLDLKYQSGILGLVRQLAHQRSLTVVVSLHDLNLAALYADRLALLAEGRLLAVGSPAEVLTPERLSQVYGVPILVTRHPLYGTPMVTPVVDREQDIENVGEWEIEPVEEGGQDGYRAREQTHYKPAPTC
jgi:iron complex transport system ATP-binding protein